MKNKGNIGKLLLVIASAVFWRMGGAQGYSKLWRRIGSTVCMTLIVWNIWAVFPIFWGNISYFGWINKILMKFKIIWVEVDREYWWNFFAENMVIQLSVLFVKQDLTTILVAISSSLVIALGKVWIDEHLTKADIKSELFHGGANALCLYINTII